MVERELRDLTSVALVLILAGARRGGSGVGDHESTRQDRRSLDGRRGRVVIWC